MIRHFSKKVKALVPDEDFLPGAEKQSKISLSDLRTLEPTKNGPLTAADVKALPERWTRSTPLPKT